MDVAKRDKVLTAALDIFLRYGYKRATMNDIAEAAGISRPALYLVFEGKEEVFKSVYEQWVKETLITIESEIGRLKTPEDKLRAAFELWTVRAFERMQNLQRSGRTAGEHVWVRSRFCQSRVSIL